MSLLGNSAVIPLGTFSTGYQLQDQLSRTISHHTWKFGTQFRRIQSNGPVDFAVNGLYTFQDLSPFGVPASSNNPALEFFLEALPLSYVGAGPSASDSDRGYRQSVTSGFAQASFRVTSRLTVNVGLRYDFYSNPTEEHGRLSAVRNPATDSGPTVGKVFCRDTPGSFVPQAGFAWKIFADSKTILRGGGGIFRDQLPVLLFGVESVSTSVFRH
jgi:outer membrane receptor protein involved in Fe transport